MKSEGVSCECDIYGKRKNYDRGEGGEIEYHKKEKSLKLLMGLMSC